MMLIKVKAHENSSREEMMRLSEIFRGRIIDVTDTVYTIELTGNSNKIDSFLEALGDKNIIEVVRTGVSGIARGNRALRI